MELGPLQPEVLLSRPYKSTLLQAHIWKAGCLDHFVLSSKTRPDCTSTISCSTLTDLQSCNHMLLSRKVTTLRIYWDQKDRSAVGHSFIPHTRKAQEQDSSDAYFIPQEHTKINWLLKQIYYQSKFKTCFSALHSCFLEVPEEMSVDTRFSLDLPDCYPNMNLLPSLTNQKSLPRPLAEEQLTHQCLNPKRTRLQEIFGCTASFPGTCPKITGKRGQFLFIYFFSPYKTIIHTGRMTETFLKGLWRIYFAC